MTTPNTQIVVLPTPPPTVVLSKEQKQKLTVQRAKAIADGAFIAMKNSAIAGRDLVASNQWGLTSAEVIEAFNLFAVGGFPGWWVQGAKLVDFVNDVVPGAVAPLPNPTAPPAE